MDDRAASAARSLAREHLGSWQAFYGGLSEFYTHLDADRYGDVAAALDAFVLRECLNMSGGV